MNWNDKKILIMAGGTGGHVYPALAIGAALREAGAHVEWLGAHDSFEEKKATEHGFHVNLIHVKPLRGQSFLRQGASLLTLARGVFEAISLFQSYVPDLIIGMGGYVSGPGGMAAKWMNVPLVVHEQNACMGWTNQKLASYATRVMLGFPLTSASGHENKSVLVGNPVRAEIQSVPEPQERYTKRQGAIRLLVLGGSQGAQALNQLIPQALALLDAAVRPQVVHQCGEKNLEATQQLYQSLKLDAQIVPFIDDMAAAYAQADYVIARAGASSVAEIATVGLPAMFIPYPHAVDDHQWANAQSLAGSALIAREATLSAAQLAEYISLYRDRVDLLQLANAARQHSHAAAVHNIMEVIKEVLDEQSTADA